MKLNDDFTVPESLLEEYQTILGVHFNDERLLISALTHSSLYDDVRITPALYMQNNGGLKYENYEKLEYLGDSILGAVIAWYSCQHTKFDDHAIKTGKSIESVLTDFKTLLVKNDNLKTLENQLYLDQFIIHGNSRNDLSSKYGDVVEAIIGAIVEDKGLDAAQSFVLDLFGLNGLDDDLDDLLNKIEYLDPKGKLQKYCEDNELSLDYELVQEEGPAHDKTYICEVCIGDKYIFTGSGKKIKGAEKDAASRAFSNLDWLTF
ncbi:hypothetical protein J7W08_07565 [Methanococcoides orientis]|uniref:ribonuclease III family protein n=1 Tax=Methanococcoides orientis TaxID=2822137 RepID=UPI001E37FB29|nr:putative dsRNA-binding protein [Methanococcoides orientis]UGV39975.1 hypothetical protein J7W08_07565 [Methanococcoides orientis]